MGALDSAFDRFRCGKGHAGNIQAVHFVNERLLIGQFAQSSHQHIAGCAHIAFKIKCFHLAIGYLSSSAAALSSQDVISIC